MNDDRTAGGSSDVEREAMRRRAEELRAEGRGGAKKADLLQACLDTIAGLPEPDRGLAERVHAVVVHEAPHLLVKTWYGFPAYADGKDVVVFFQQASRFGSRYSTLGFNDTARLDDGDIWPTSYALIGWSDDVKARVVDLVRRATGATVEASAERMRERWSGVLQRLEDE